MRNNLFFIGIFTGLWRLDLLDLEWIFKLEMGNQGSVAFIHKPGYDHNLYIL